MKISLSFVLLFAGAASFGCSFNSKISKVYSLSGPLTVALKEMGLLTSPKLLGISIFHPVTTEEFKGKLLPGGIFLSREMISEMNGSIVFFDESRELARMFKDVPGIMAREIKTRGLFPHETVELVSTELKKHTEGCEKEFKGLHDKSERLASELLAKFTKKNSVIFFLGEIRGKRPPAMAMVNDGIVKWLVDQKKLQTYPTALAYVSWSAKIMHQLPPERLEVGVKDSGRAMIKEVKKLDDKKFNLIYPGSLIPGITQQEAWLYFFNSI